MKTCIYVFFYPECFGFAFQINSASGESGISWNRYRGHDDDEELHHRDTITLITPVLSCPVLSCLILSSLILSRVLINVMTPDLIFKYFNRKFVTGNTFDYICIYSSLEWSKGGVFVQHEHKIILLLNL